MKNKNQNAKQSKDENNNQNVNELTGTGESKGVENHEESKDIDQNVNNQGSEVLDTNIEGITTTFRQTSTSNYNKETEMCSIKFYRQVQQYRL